MKLMNKMLLFGIIVLCFLIACDKNPGAPKYQKEITIFGYLRGNESLNADHAIMIAYSQPVTNYYDMQKAAITGATVIMKDITNDILYPLKDTLERPGFYFNDTLLIQPKTTYQLRVEIDGKVATATTTVPPELIISTELSEDTTNAVYRKNLGTEKPIFLQCENEDQLVVVDMYCNESYQNAEYVYPFHESHKYPENQEEYDGGRNAEPRHIIAFARLKDFASDMHQGRYTIFWYSSMIVFYGSNTLQVLAIDDNYHNYIYSEHPELTSGVNGGIGVLGSLYGKKYELMVLKP